MNSGSSALISSGGQSGAALARASWYQRSRPSTQPIWPPVRRTTKQVLTEGQRASASSALALSGILRPPRSPSSAVMRQLESQSWMRPTRLSGEKPPKTTLWIAPMRAQASMAKAASGIIGM